MVARSEDKPRTVTERINSTSKRVDEAVRAQARGAPALRDASGNILQMNADAPYPLLTPLGIDSAIGFGTDGTISIVSADTTEDRGLSAGTIASSGQISASGQITADTMGTNTLGVGTVNAGAVNCGSVHLDGNGLSTIGVAASGTIGCGNLNTGNIVCNQVNTTGDIYAPGRAVNTDGAAGGNHRGADFYGGTFHGVLVASERRLKHDLGRIDPADARRFVLGLAPSWFTWRDPENRRHGRDAHTHAGLYVDEIRDLSPDLIRDEMRPPEEGEGTEPIPNGEQTYEDRGVLAYLAAHNQALQAEVDELRERLDRLEDKQ